MADNQSIYQHFSPEDKDFIDQMLDILDRVQERYAFEVTRFLNPHQAQIVTSLANGNGLQCFSSRELAETEMVRLLLAPDYYQLNTDDFELALLEIDYPSKFYQLTHGQILGTLLNRLGVERSVFGDLIVTENRAQFFVDRQFTQYFKDNVKKIAKVPVELREISLSEKLEVLVSTKTKEILVSSMRLDKLVSSACKVSRTNASSLISKGMVKVNYKGIERTDFPLSLGDLVSVRGFGRFQIQSENGLSKSGKQKVTVAIITSK